MGSNSSKNHDDGLWRRAALAVADAFWELDPESDEVTWHSSAAEVFGYPVERLGGTEAWWKARIHPDDRRRVLSESIRIVEKGDGAWETEYRFRRADGTYAWIFFRGTVWHRPEGRAARILGAMFDFTERKKEEEKLRQSEQSLQLAVQGARIGIWNLDLRTGRAVWSDEHKRLFGIPLDEPITYERALAVVHPDDRERADATIRRAIQRREAYSLEFRTVGPFGSVRWAISMGRAFYDETSGEAVFMSGITYDITERKEAEEALRRNRAQLQTVIENIGEGVVASTMEGDLLHWNRAALKMHGFAGNEEWRRRFGDFTSIFELSSLDGSVIPLEQWPLSRILRGEALRDQDLRIRRLENGWERIFSYGGTLVRDADDRPLMAIVTMTDITDRKAREQSLRESEARYRAVVEQATVGIAHSDLAGKFIFVNERFCSIVGRRREELLGGLRMQDLTDERDRPRNKNLFRRLIEEGTSYSIEKRYVRPDGSTVWVENEVRLVSDAAGRPLYTQSITQDISERKEMDRLKNEFISTAAHELRTPLTTVMGYLELLIQTGQPFTEEEKREFLEVAFQQSEVLERIIRDLLDLSSIQAGRLLTLEKSPGNLTALIGRIVEAWQGPGGRHLFSLELTDFPEELCFDAGKIGQVLDNLFSNAVKFSPMGGLIRIRGRRLDGEVQVTVEDQGIGMRPDQVERIFDNFYRADASNTAVGGLGLGMCISRNVIQAHGGRIWVESEQGKGTRVHFTLPLE